ncbi:hypothetical protein J6590_037285 [Homalodisca vitripennis]|nr:hypothetical protein J6590_037285 [Homalodisca vitripennis]
MNHNVNVDLAPVRPPLVQRLGFDAVTDVAHHVMVTTVRLESTHNGRTESNENSPRHGICGISEQETRALNVHSPRNR